VRFDLEQESHQQQLHDACLCVLVLANTDLSCVRTVASEMAFLLAICSGSIAEEGANSALRLRR
jgi:hypothetical protein